LSTKQLNDENSEKYRLLFEASDDPMWLIVDQKFENCNDAAVRVLGYSSEKELQSTHPSQLSPEFQPDGQSSFSKAEKLMKKALKKGYHRFEWVHTRKNGKDFPVEVTLTKIPFEGKDAIFCVWRDITERKNLESDLKNAIEVAEQANNAKSNFLSMMSHELRTPLNAVLGFSEMLKTEISGPLNEKQMGIASAIYEGGELLLHLVDDLLNMTRIEQGELKLKIKKNNVANIQINAANIVNSLADSSEITIHITPVEPKQSYVFADKVRTEQIIVNLLANAIKYNRKDGNVWLSVELHNEQYIRFIIKDDGFGIQKKYAGTVFEPFNRGDKTSSGIEGTGLGLPICKRLAEAMNGSCDFNSTYPDGSTFWLDLPMCE
jgi:PAS domain S-box-containing protein